MFKGIKLVGIVMVVMILIGTMMVPAHADYDKTATFEERFEVLFDLYLEREGLEDYFEVIQIEDLEGDPFEAYAVDIRFTDTAVNEIVNELGIKSDNASAYASMLIWYDDSYVIVAKLFVDGEEYDSETLFGENILEDFNIE